MGGSPKNTTTTQKVEPWDSAKPYYETLYGAAQQAFQNTDRSPYTGQLYAGPTADQQSALNLFRQQAQALAARDPGAMTVGIPQTQQLALDTIGGKYLSPDSNPYIKAAVEAAQRPVQNTLMRSILPQLEDQNITQGAYAGTGNAVMKALATSDFTQQALDIGSRMYDANYQRERQNQLSAPALLAQAQALQGTADQMALLPAQLMDLAGSQQQSWAQAALDAELQRYNINQQAPWAGLGEWAQILNGGGFQSAGTTQPGPSRAASFLQGAAGTAALANSFGAGDWLSNLFRGGGGGSGGLSAAVSMPANLSALLAGGW